MTARAPAPADRYAIRRATPGDHEGVVRELHAYLAHIGVEPDPRALDRDVAEWRREYDGVSGALLVVEGPDGVIVGTAGLRRLEPGVGEIKRMWIRPSCQGQGLGRRLMDRCLEEGRALGFRRLRLDTQRRMAAAVRLYRRYGFAEIADYNGNPRAEIWMEAALEPDAPRLPSPPQAEG
jgi:ribosomal protein S18 acetylase RimI-like enzyme